MYANMANGDDQEQWLSIGEAAEFLGISRDTLRRWEKKGKVKVYRSPTNRRIYKQSDLDELYKGKSPNHQTTKLLDRETAGPEYHEATSPKEQETAEIEEKKDEQVGQDTSIEIEKAEVVDLQATAAREPTWQASIKKDPEVLEKIKEAEEISQPAARTEDLVVETEVMDKSEEGEVPEIELPKTEPPTPPSPTVTPPSTSPTLKSSMPMTPSQSRMSSVSPSPVVVSEEKVETKSANVLKIIAIVLALILVGLGITITALVFV